MRKSFLGICSVLAVAILLLAVFIPGCGGTTGTIVVKATLDGSPWTGNVSYTLTPASGSPTSGTYVEQTFTGVAAGNWTCAYVSGGPAAFLNITPSAIQSVTAGGTTTFVLNFVSVQVDASVTFLTWTINGLPVPPGVHWVQPNDIIDAAYAEHVSGQQVGQVVPVHQTSWLQIHNMGFEGQPGPDIQLHVVNHPDAVKMNPPAESKSNQQCTLEGNPVDVCTYITLHYCEPVWVDVEVDWELKVCTNYTKTINWLSFPSAPDILFDLQALNFTCYNLISYACLEVGEGFEDTNPQNDCTGNSSMLTICILPPP